MPLGFFEKHLHRRATGGHDAQASRQQDFTPSNSRKGSRAWVEDCCGAENDLYDDPPPIPSRLSHATPKLNDLHPQLDLPGARNARPSLTGSEDLHELLQRNSQSMGGVLVLLLGIVVLTWTLGACGASWAWLLVSVGITWAVVRGSLERVAEDASRYVSLRLHRRRALQADETCEWLNILLNRWWVFSSSSIFAKAKAALDPRLLEAKPAFLETISLKQLSLGDRTPVIRSVRAWDVSTPGVEGVSRRPLCPSRPPAGLDHAPTHTVALLCDLALDSDSFSAVLAARIGGKGMGVDLDVAVEKLAVLGRVMVTATLDMEAPFPHLTRLSLSFTEKPQVWFSVRILKAVQMMEVPVLKTWLHSLVMDALASAWVDPGQLEINIHSSEAFVPEQRTGDALAQGVLTVILWTQKGSSGLAVDEDKWVVVLIGGQQHVTPPLNTPRWQEACSFLVDSSLNNHNLVLKVKSKRLITTTITQFDLPLSQYSLDTSRVVETVLHKKGVKVMGGSVPPLHLRLQYTPLTAVNLDVPLPPALVENQEGAGVLYILVHGADNITTSDYLPSCYCLIFSNRKKVKTTHYVCECGSPRWECGVEVLVREVSSVTLSFAVCSMPRGSQDTELLGLTSFSLATMELPIVRRQLPLSRSLPTPGCAVSSGPSPGTVTISVVFRAVASVAGCNMPSGEMLSDKYPPQVSRSPVPPCSSLSAPPQRRSSLPSVDDDELATKKRNNTHWISHAKQLLATGRDGDGGTQDIGDILASGLGLMELTIIRARDLVAKDLNGYSDPYCVVKINSEVKYRTRVKKKTLNPEWEETLMTHLPRHPDILAITLWDHDAFGRDFLGSVALKESDVRDLSHKDAPKWCTLEGTKSGQIEIRVKVISDDYEHQIIPSTTDTSLTSSTAVADDMERTDEMSRSNSVKDEVAGASSGEDSGVLLHQSSPTHETETPRLPRMGSQSVSYVSGDHPLLSNGRRASESAVLMPKNHTRDDQDSSLSGSVTPSTSSPVRTVSKSRRTGANIIASALAMARSHPRPETPNGDSSSSSHCQSDNPVTEDQSSGTNGLTPTSKSHGKPLPKISLTEHSEDDYGGSSPEHHVKSKKSSDSGLRAMREKMRRGFAHPLRRFRSEANVRDAPNLSAEVSTSESSGSHADMNLSVGISSGMRVGVGGGEGDASELLDLPLSHAKSQPNLLLLPGDANRSTSSTKVGVTNSLSQRPGVFLNVRGIAGQVQGLHIPRSGLQLFLRVRVSEEKSASSSSSSSNKITKTVGRSRLVPASPSPTFDCEWIIEGEATRRAVLVLEIRTGSRELLNSANVVLGDLFTEPGVEGSVETWVNLQGGASINLRANHGGEAPPSSRRRSLFRSWSLHKLGRI
ncbi:uncharacterized protein LOC125031428 isoform X1 [Penaeus chinensis]|uniref:uncharacterized protein LOC125031428 isoform X1 n=2 Tax=Penaeus chinensis TaxID=139456 RepID=UPI001FB78E5A|nr:uncharacterized protein LOC125031428 isoform X1 [Penaeus chinensis]XP_047478111.1 uncharacterized protein LOC125031428 isoform X1 [Penaeus chinensis]